MIDTCPASLVTEFHPTNLLVPLQEVAKQKAFDLQVTDFNELRRLPSQGNTLNYVADLLEACRDNLENLEVPIRNLYENLKTAIIEHPYADAVGIYQFENRWVPDEAGQLRLLTDGGWLDAIIDRSVNDTTGQVPIFEQQRNKLEGTFLEELTNARNQDDTSIGVMFSPSPQNLDDPEVQARGYQGNDQIRISELSEDGIEIQTIYWMPQCNPEEYRELAYKLLQANYTEADQIQVEQQIQHRNQLNKKLQLLENQSLSDLSIMSFSGMYSPTQIEIIKDFIAERQTHLTITPEELKTYIDTDINGSVNEIIFHIVQAVLLCLNGIEAEELIRYSKNELMDRIKEAQFRFRLFLRDRGQDTFTNEVYVPAELTLNIFTNMGRNDQMNVLTPYSASGCGFGSPQASLKTGKELWGPMLMGTNSVEINGLYPENFGEPHLGACIDCGITTTVGGCELCVRCHYKY